MSYLKEYIEFLHKHEETHCSKKLAQMYFEDIEPIVDGKSKKYYFDEEAGLNVIRFIQGDIKSSESFSRLLKKVPETYKTNYEKVSYLEEQGYFLGFVRQSKGSGWVGLPLVLELFQKAYLEALYGIKRKSNHKRRFTESWFELGRKNGKTSLQVPIALWAMMEEPGGEVYAASGTYAQAKRLWDQAVLVIDKSPALKEVFIHRIHEVATITNVKNDSVFKPLSKNTDAQDGLNSCCNIIDEAHALPDETYNILKEATSATDEPLTDIITTAGYVRGALFDNKYDYYSKVLDGAIDDDRVLILIYELDSEEEMNDKSKWYKANPGLGTIKKMEYMEEAYTRAKNDSEAMRSFLTKDLNIRGVQKNAWLNVETILKGAYGPYKKEIIDDPVKQEEFLKQFDDSIVLGGYDLSRIGDLTSATTALFDRVNKTIIFKSVCWCTKAFLESAEAKASKVPWQAWIKKGYVRMSSDPNKINYVEIADYFENEFLKHGYYYEHIAYDPWSAAYLTEEIAQRGWDKQYIQVPVRQGYKTLSVPIQTLEAYLREGKICYLNNPVTKWMMTNVEMVADRNGNLLPQKVNENRASKIDTIATFFDIFAVFCDNISDYLD